MALIYFAVSLFVSAFLLFLVQPMIGKMILPRLGGTPQVWNTCMMFFQTVLLAGYAYTHTVTSKLPLKKQLLVHCIMLLLPLPVLLMFGRPFAVANFGAEGGGNPIFVTLGLLTMIVGIPFLVVSTTAPLLQRWFNHTGHPAAADPYFLYGASNAGSILGLLLYPVLVERELGLNDQAWFWLFGYIVLAVLVAGCALMVLKAPPTVQLPGGEAPPPDTEPPPAEMPMPPPVSSTAVTETPPAPRVSGIRRGGKQRGGRGGRPAVAPMVKSSAISIKKTMAPEPVEPDKPFEMTPLRRLRWVGLAAVPSSLMLGCTTYISTDISPIPLLWIIPLTLYLLSFVFVFSRWSTPWVGAMYGVGATLALKLFDAQFGLSVPLAVELGVGLVVWVGFTIVAFRWQLPWVGVGRNPRGWTPHKVIVVIQLAAIPAVMLVYILGGYSKPLNAMMICWGAFFLTALVCHGELARDRPPARFLTEFYLWMSVGGMVGGTFNAMIAPQVQWWGLFEFPLALVFAGLVRPGAKGWNWTDWFFENMPKEQSEPLRYLLDIALAALLLAFSWWLVGHSHESRWMSLWDPEREGAGATAKNLKVNPLFGFVNKTLGVNEITAYGYTHMLALGLTYFVPIGLALLTWKRPTRLALCFGAVLLGNAFFEVGADDRTLYRDRSYFGLLRVVQEQYPPQEYIDKGEKLLYRATTLMHGTTYHGRCYNFPDGTEGLPDMSRLATTYYHRECPVGVVMERLNWFPGYKSDPKPSLKPGDPSDGGDFRMTYWADARLPASMIGSGAPGFGMNLPLPQIVSAWSEPPYATIGLGTGTMASYGRPYQHVVFYEIDEHIRDFSLPPEGRKTYFTYLQGTIRRGSKLEVIMGDARLTMTKEPENANSSYYRDYKNLTDKNTPLKWDTFTSVSPRESYYRAIEVDAFSSDAIPIHLITKEAIELYMNKLMPNGVLCVHTSNRHVNLVLPVLGICQVAEWKDWLDRDADGTPKKKTGLAWVVCKDEGADDEGKGFDDKHPAMNGHFRSEYVLVARKQEYLPPYDLTKDEIANFKAANAFAMSFTYKQEELYAKEGLKLLPKREKGQFSSSIDFYGPDSYGDAKVNYLIRNRRYPDGIKVMDAYEYTVPKGMRVWTDDYSNVLSVFRW